MATADYSWPNSPQADIGRTGRTATVVDADPPDNFSSWPNRNRPQVGPSGWPIQKVPQRRSSRPLPPVDRVAHPAQRSRPVGRWLFAVSLWALAGGLFAGPALSNFGDRCVETAIPWIRSWAPAFLRPYLPKPPEAPRPLPRHANVARTVPATPPVAPERAAKHDQAHRAHQARQPRLAHVTHAKNVAAPSASDPFEPHKE